MNTKLLDFFSCKTTEEIYQKIIILGKSLKPFDPSWKKEENLVLGCQSVMYLHSESFEGKMRFYAYSEALISAGLAALLIEFYNEKTPEWILSNPPLFLSELKIPASLTPSRVNGLSSLYDNIRKRAMNEISIAQRNNNAHFA